jgi:hypothetical protein
VIILVTLEKLTSAGSGIRLGIFCLPWTWEQEERQSSVNEYRVWKWLGFNLLGRSPKKDRVVVYFRQLIPAHSLDDHNKVRALVYPAIWMKRPRKLQVSMREAHQRKFIP